ncbi:MAG: hypothetical protein LBK45_03225 [Tannerellaceae bacterium]|jgi:uncharacterized protein (DUF608 family)|nr:hypothetical protein [Tannerellaceae bacterium]
MENICYLRLIAAFLCIPFFSVAQFSGDHKVSLNKGNIKSFVGDVRQKGERKVYKGEELTTIGMPCGGIMAGQLYVRGDGTLANWWIANNAYNTGYGIDGLLNFDTPLGPWKVCYQTFEPPSYIDQGFRITVDDGLQKVTKELSKKDFDDIGFIGEYPVAFIDYASKSNELPVKVTSMVYTPFIPLNAKESATPATILKYKVTNTSAKPVSVDLTGWLQNLVCIDLKDEAYGTLRNKTVSNGEMQAVYMEMDPASGSPSSSEKPRYQIDESHPYLGNIALTVFDPDATATADIAKGIQSLAEASLGEKLTGGITSTMTLKQGESKEVVFVLSWYFPNRPLSYKGSSWNRPLAPNTPPIGNIYSNWYNGSLDVVTQLHDKYRRLEAETLTFHDTYYNQTSLPYWLIHRLMMSVSTLASETCQWWTTGKFWAWEGVGSCEGTCTHVWGYAQTMAALFPELERNLREMTDYSVSLRDDGAILSRNGEHGVLIDGHASVILRMYREHLMSKNNYFLSRNWDKVKKSIEYIIREDHPHHPDGLIVCTQPNTYDIAFNGANTYVGGLYLAALRACEQMALIMKDSIAASRYKTIYEAGSKNTMDRLWNETFGYFIQDVDEKEYPLYQYGKGCLSDQLFGQSWSDLLRLGNLYPEHTIGKTLQSVWKYNWTNDVGPQTGLHLPERYYAHAGEPGLLICTWPFSKHPGEAGVRYRDEVWTGIEYQVATNMIFRGMMDEGLAIVKAIHSRYDGKKHNPWNEVECGDHYARAMASYGVLTAIQDYWYDGPKGIMGFAPKLMPDKFSGFFTSAEGWGNITQTRSERMQQNTVEVKYGRLMLGQLNLSPLPGISPKEIKIFHNGKEIPASVEQNNNITITFNKIELKKGDQLKVTLI